MQRALTIEDLFQKYQSDKGVPLSSDVIRWANKFGSTIEPEEEAEFSDYYKNLLAQANPPTYLGGESGSYSNDGMGRNKYAEREAEMKADGKLTQAEIDAALRAEQVADRAKLPALLAQAAIPGLAAIKGVQNFFNPPTKSYAVPFAQMSREDKEYAQNINPPAAVMDAMIAAAEANDARGNTIAAAMQDTRDAAEQAYADQATANAEADGNTGTGGHDAGITGTNSFGGSDGGYNEAAGGLISLARGGAVRFNEGGPTLEEMASDDRSMVDRVIDTLPDNFFGVPISPDTYKNFGMTGLGYMLGIGPLMAKYNQAKYGTKAALTAYDMSMGNMPAFRGYSAPVENRSTYSDDALNEAMDKAIQSGEMAKGTDVDGSAGGDGGGFSMNDGSGGYGKADSFGNMAKGGLIDKASWADGGPVKTHYAEGDSVRATPQNAALGSIANLIKESYSPRRTQQMQGVSKFFDMPALARTVERLSYGEPITNIGKANVPLIPEDTAAAAMLVGPPLGSFAKRVGTNLIQTAPYVARDMLTSMASPMRSYAVKQKGGNWLAGGIEDAVAPLRQNPILSGEIINNAAGRDLFSEYRKVYDQDPRIGLYQWTRENHPDIYEELLGPELATNNWVDKTLYKYIKNDMGTPEDPMRALAERGPMHIDTDQVNYILDAYGKYPKPGQEFLAKSDLAKVWEGAVDNNISTERADKFLDLSDPKNPYAHVRLQDNPWLSKVPPETQINDLIEPDNLTYDLGFHHMVDEMRNAIDPGSGLPARLMIDPAKLEKMTVPQISERVGQINAWRAAQKIEADLARSMNPATQIVKEYPDQGMRWVELKAPKDKPLVEGEYADPMFDIPQNQQDRIMQQAFDRANRMGLDEEGDEYMMAVNDYAQELSTEWAKRNKPKVSKELEDALKYEGETMGHCVGGYCPDVASGKSRIYSLRDAKGQPHVTIETQPSRSNSIKSMREGNPTDYKITQIKGKSNRAPKEDYLPFVQDFVKSGQWTEVGDIKNSGLIDIRNPNLDDLRILKKFSPELDLEKAVGIFKSYIEANPQSSRYITADEIGDLGIPLPKGFADGGMVGDPIAAYDPLQIDLVMNSIDAPRAYAEGGSVSVYDPNQIDAIVNQYM